MPELIAYLEMSLPTTTTTTTTFRQELIENLTTSNS